MTNILGQYKLEGLVAKGGMAEIYAAYPIEGGPKICIKRIRPEFSSDREFESMFRQEAKIAMALSHENIVKVFELDRQDSSLFLAMEYVDGMDLKHVIRGVDSIGMKLPVGFAFHAFASLLKALEAAFDVTIEGHKGPVIHRDISPHNLMVSSEGVVKLTDFGIAKAKGATNVTRTGVIKGKLAYLSPEQVLGKEVGPSADLFCAGLLLYELLTGKRMNGAGGEHEIIARVMNPVVPDIPWLSDSINAYLKRIMAKKVSDRFSDPSTALAELEKLNLPKYDQREAGLLVTHLVKTVEFNTNETSSYPEMLQTLLDKRQEDSSSVISQVKESLAQKVKTPRFLGGIAAFFILTIGILMWLLIFSQPSSSHEQEHSLAVNDDELNDNEKVTQSLEKNTEAEKGSDESSLVVMLSQGEVGSEELDSTGEENQGEEEHAEEEQTEEDEHSGDESEKEPLGKSSQQTRSQSTTARAASSSQVTHHGSLQVICRPWARVLINGKEVGTTPISEHKLPVGNHRVVLVNEQLDYRKNITVRIERDKKATINERIE